MNMTLEILIGLMVYSVLFMLTMRHSRQKVLLLQERLARIRQMQQEQQASSEQSIRENQQKMAELESLIQKLGDENKMLKLELEEKKARLDYNNKVAVIEQEKRMQAETLIFSSDAYQTVRRCLADGRMMTESEWLQLAEVVNSVYTGFTERLFSLYKMTEQDYRVTLLIKVRIQPKDIAGLTAHSKESVASTRSRLYQRVFGQKGSTKNWDDFVLSL